MREQQYRNRAKAKPGKLGKRPSQLRRPMGQRFFYKAMVQRVVDGDTLLVILYGRYVYGRYVAHVFYAPGETDKRRIVQKGAYLNQRLVDEGLAKAL